MALVSITDLFCENSISCSLGPTSNGAALNVGAASAPLRVTQYTYSSSGCSTKSSILARASSALSFQPFNSSNTSCNGADSRGSNATRSRST